MVVVIIMVIVVVVADRIVGVGGVILIGYIAIDDILIFIIEFMIWDMEKK